MLVIKNTKAAIKMWLSRKTINPLFALLAIGTVITGANAERHGRILGGKIATSGEYRATVKLKMYSGSTTYDCGGAVISRRHILTAAHCVDVSRLTSIKVRAGVYDITNNRYAVDRVVTKIFKHPRYVPQTSTAVTQNDIAVLVLDHDLPLGRHITTYHLPTKSPTYQRSYKIAGWGLVRPNSATSQQLKSITMTLCPPNESKPHTFCAKVDSGATCPGDSGSPLIRKGYVYGIVSTSRCIAGLRTTFSDVYYYRNWITTTIRQNPN